MKAVAATCADQAFIIDEFPPHEWHGAGACAKWMDDYDADAKKNGITDGIVTLGVPLHVDVTADRAYVASSGVLGQNPIQGLVEIAKDAKSFFPLGFAKHLKHSG